MNESSMLIAINLIIAFLSTCGAWYVLVKIVEFHKRLCLFESRLARLEELDQQHKGWALEAARYMQELRDRIR